MKKLTQGQFAFTEHVERKKSLSWPELQWLIDGIEFEKIKYRKRYILPSKTENISI
jgi:hypothetical protein